MSQGDVGELLLTDEDLGLSTIAEADTLSLALPVPPLAREDVEPGHADSWSPDQMSDDSDAGGRAPTQVASIFPLDSHWRPCEMWHSTEETALSRPPVGHQVERFENGPVVILQSCHSLEDVAADDALERGATAVVGTATSIHSASGSSFVKALCDAALYHHCTLGEALRDARNFQLSLVELRAKRGHREYEKLRRVALSFRLLGDPEAVLLPLLAPRPELSPVHAQWEPDGAVRVKTPSKALPSCETDTYVCRLFPGAEAAGIVKSVKERRARKVLPLFFFRLPAAGTADAGLERRFATWPGEERPRAIALPDPLGRFVYVTYMLKTTRVAANADILVVFD